MSLSNIRKEISSVTNNSWVKYKKLIVKPPNWLWKELDGKYCSWEELNKTYKTIYNNKMTEFRKLEQKGKLNEALRRPTKNN